MLIRWVLAMAFLTLSANAVDVFTIDWHTVDGGGASFLSTTDGTNALAGTIGQHDASGPLSGGAFELTGGFWAHAALSGNGTWIVTNTNDSGDGSLRDILGKVSHGDTVTFAADPFSSASVTTTTIPRSDLQIQSLQPLPSLDKGFVTINAQDKFVTLDGGDQQSATTGLRITTAGNIVQGLSIVRFDTGILLEGAASGNLLGGNRETGSVGNKQGLRVSGNRRSGILIKGPGCSGNTIKGCWVGLSATPFADLNAAREPNDNGIFLSSGANNNTIGSTVAGEANVISGNRNEAITIADPGTDDNVIIGNIIGLKPLSPSALRRDSLDSRAFEDTVFPTRNAAANGRGVFVQRGSKRTRIGSKSGGAVTRDLLEPEGNIIGRNASAGIVIQDGGSTGNTSRGNRISKNGSGNGLGISLQNGGNGNLPPPTRAASRAIEKVADNADGSVKIKVSGTVSKAGGFVEIFSDEGDQGGVLIGRTAVAASDFTAEVDAFPNRNVSATYTDVEGNTSGFVVIGVPTGSGGSGGNTLNDSDGDGVPDILETQLGSSPADPQSVPSGVTPGTAPSTLQISKLSVKIAFTKKNPSKANDTISLSGSINLADDFLFTQQDVVFTIGGVVRVFPIDTKGSGKTAAKDTLKMGKPKGGISKLSVKIAKDDFVDEFQDEGLTNDTLKNEKRPVSAAMFFNGTIYQGTISLSYTAKAGKTGSAK